MPPTRSVDWIDRRCMIDCGMWRGIDRTRSTSGSSRRTIGSVDNTWIDCIHNTWIDCINSAWIDCIHSAWIDCINGAGCRIGSVDRNCIDTAVTRLAD